MSTLYTSAVFVVYLTVQLFVLLNFMFPLQDGFILLPDLANSSVEVILSSMSHPVLSLTSNALDRCK